MDKPFFSKYWKDILVLIDKQFGSDSRSQENIGFKDKSKFFQQTLKFISKNNSMHKIQKPREEEV